MPTLTRYQPPSEGWNQNKQRGLGLFYDQHRTERFPDGRPWWCYTERPADGAHMPHPVGELIPHGWAAPWVPDATYMQMSMGTLQTNKFRIMYERMITDYRQAMEEFYQRASAEALSANLPLPEYGEALTWKLRSIVGLPPRSPRIPEAALAGDRWLLGATLEPNEYLQRLLESGDVRIGRANEVPIADLINRTSMPDMPAPAVYVAPPLITPTPRAHEEAIAAAPRRPQGAGGGTPRKIPEVIVPDDIQVGG